MNFNDYVNAMDEVHMDQEKLLKKLQKKESSSYIGRHPRFLQPCAAFLILVMISAVLWNASLSEQEHGFTITVHAAGSESALLPGDSTSVQGIANPYFEAVDMDVQKGIINYDLWLECTGEDIASITYRCQDILVTKENMGDVSCYFVRNLVISSRDREQYDYIRSLQSSTEIDQGICHIVQLIGNEYTVLYKEQEEQSTGIEVRITQEDDIARADPFQISVRITLTDGSVRNQTLLLTPEDDASYGLKIELLK